MNNKKYNLVRTKFELKLKDFKKFLRTIFNEKNKVKIISTFGAITIIAGALLIKLVPGCIAGDCTNKVFDISYSVSENVDSGETLSAIAEKYGTTVERIAQDNNIENPDIIEVGQNLIINLEMKATKYKVEKGETLSEIALQHNTTIDNIMKINQLENINIIEENQILNIPYVEPKKLDLDAWDEKIAEKGYVQGIDLSYCQETMDLNSVLEKNNMIDFVYARSFYFWTTREVDIKFDEFSQIAAYNGKALGTYFWPTLKDKNSTKEELDILINKLKENESKGIYYTMPIALDIETGQNAGDLAPRIKNKDQKTLESFEFAINYLRDAGYEVIVYTGAACARDYGVAALAQQNNVELWLSGSEKFNHNIGIKEDPDKYLTRLNNLEGVGIGRQYCHGGKVVGYDGNIDLDVWYENTPRKIIEGGYNNTDEMPKDQIKK